MTARPRTRFGTAVAWAWVLAMSVAVGWVVVNEAGESRRLRAALAAEQARQETEALREDRARCGKWKGEAGADVLPSTSDLGRVIVRTAAASYELDPACVPLLGELGPVDPEAYRSATTPPR